MVLRALQINVNHSGAPHNLALSTAFEWECDLVAISESYFEGKSAVTHPNFSTVFSSSGGLVLIYISNSAKFAFLFTNLQRLRSPSVLI